jgi:hypothetical protein
MLGLMLIPSSSFLAPTLLPHHHHGRVREEQKRLRPDPNAPITGEVLAEMKYTKQVRAGRGMYKLRGVWEMYSLMVHQAGACQGHSQVK